MQVSKSNHKSTKSAIKNLEIQVGQLAKQIAEKSSSIFGASTEHNPKEECKVVMTRGRMGTMIEDEERKVKENQEPVCELGEGEEEEKYDQLRETPIIVNKKERNEEENKEKQKQNEKK